MGAPTTPLPRPCALQPCRPSCATAALLSLCAASSVRSLVRRLVSASLSLPSPLKGAEGERAKERGLRPSRRRHRRVKAGQDGSRKEEEEEEGPSDRGFPAP